MNPKEPETQLSIIMVAFLGYLSLPFLYWLWLNHELEAGAFPVDADSIGIPMAGFVIVWFVGLVMAPAGILFTVMCCKIVRQLTRSIGLK